MRSRGCFLAVFAAVLVMATAGHAIDTDVVGAFGETIVAARNPPEGGSHGAVFSGPTSIADSGLQADSDLEPSGEPAQEEAIAGNEVDWLTIPPDPSRHNLWVPSAEWAVCLGLTIPLFMIDPGFVNVGPVSADSFADAWTRPPVWDTDGHVANYVLHPIMGAEAYLTVRNRDYGPIESFLFSTGVSVAWEYLFEGWVERPSGQDLLVTSPIGSLQGELRFQMRRRIAQWRPSVGRDTLLVLVDPVEALHRYIGKQFLNRSNDATGETMGSSMNFGPDQAKVMITMEF